MHNIKSIIEKGEAFFVWEGFCDNQQVRWNARHNFFEHREDEHSDWIPVSGDRWEWLIPTGTVSSLHMNTLLNLMMLLHFSSHPAGTVIKEKAPEITRDGAADFLEKYAKGYYDKCINKNSSFQDIRMVANICINLVNMGHAIRQNDKDRFRSCFAQIPNIIKEDIPDNIWGFMISF